MGRFLPLSQACIACPCSWWLPDHALSLLPIWSMLASPAGEKKDILWQAVLGRSQKASTHVSSPTPNLEKSVISTLRLGDVRKALQLFVSAPIAPKCDATFAALKALHPAATSHVEPAAAPVHDAPSFTADRVREALCSHLCCWSLWLSPQSASAMRSCRFISLHLYPSHVSLFTIALQKSATAVRPLYCGDPLRRLVAKCFCLTG